MTQARARSKSGRLARAFWFAPAAIGLMLILFGVLIFARPQLLAYLVATAFVCAGLSFFLIGWQMRSRISYRQIHFGPTQDADQP